jgi:hypothetical protein
MLYRYGNGSYHHIDNHLNSQDCRAIHFINHIPKKTGNGNCKFPVCEPRMAYTSLKFCIFVLLIDYEKTNCKIMKVLVEVNDNKGDFILELLNNFSFARAKMISPAKAQLLEEIKEAVENLNLVKQGKIKARPAKELLDEL